MNDEDSLLELHRKRAALISEGMCPNTLHVLQLEGRFGVCAPCGKGFRVSRGKSGEPVITVNYGASWDDGASWVF